MPSGEEFELEVPVTLQAVPSPMAVVINGTPVPFVTKWDCTNSGNNDAGTFNIEILDVNQSLSDYYHANDVVQFYLYNSANQTMGLVFGGYIDTIGYEIKGFPTLKLSGQGWLGRYHGMTFNKEYATATEVSVAVKDILAQFPDVSVVNVDATGTTLDRLLFQGENSFSALRRLADSVNMRIWITPDKKAYFKSEANLGTTTDSLVYGTSTGNILQVDRQADTTSLYNSIEVFGGTPSAHATAVDTTSEATYGEKDLQILNNQITVYADAQTLANAALTAYKNPRTSYTIRASPIFDVILYDEISTTIPYLNLSNTLLEVVSLGYEFNTTGTGIATNLTLEEKLPQLPYALANTMRQMSVDETVGLYDYYMTTFPELGRGQSTVTVRYNATISVVGSLGSNAYTDVTLYTVPAGKSFYITSATICMDWSMPNDGGNNLGGRTCLRRNGSGALVQPYLSDTGIFYTDNSNTTTKGSTTIPRYWVYADDYGGAPYPDSTTGSLSGTLSRRVLNSGDTIVASITKGGGTSANNVNATYYVTLSGYVFSVI